MAALVALDLERIADVIRHHDRHPDRAHYVEHALALCADRGHAVDQVVLADVLERAARVGLRVMGAQAMRVRGLSGRDPQALRTALEAFEAMGAGRYAARCRLELGLLTGEAPLVEAARREMQSLGEGDLLPTA